MEVCNLYLGTNFPMDDLLFLKLGGSLLTDKTGVEAPRLEVISQVAAELAAAQRKRPNLQLVLGHGSGSFGHVAAARYGTRRGVRSAEQWNGFAAVSAAAARLNRLITEALLRAGVTAISLQPSASAYCTSGELRQFAWQPVWAAVLAGLTPVVYGDVAFDAKWGGTIISTEEILKFLVNALPKRPSWLLLAGKQQAYWMNRERSFPSLPPIILPRLSPP